MFEVYHEILGTGTKTTMKGLKIIKGKSTKTIGIQFRTDINHYDIEGMSYDSKTTCEELTRLTGRKVLNNHGNALVFFTKEEIEGMRIGE